MNTDSSQVETQHNRTGLSPIQVLLIVLVTIVLTAALSYWVLSRTLFLREFEPVQLKPQEERILNSKLRSIGLDVMAPTPDAPQLKPEPYSEASASRQVTFTERELNAMLAKNTDLSKKLAIDLSDDLVSAILLVPLEPDFPILGGKTLRVHAGVELAYVEQRPIVRLKGVSLMGVPIPNAWLGNLKNVDLVNEFSADEGFWKSFADGVEHIRVEEGRLKLELKE